MSDAPGSLRLAVNFAKAVVRHAGDGLAVLSEEEVTARLAVCTGEATGTPCEHFDGSSTSPRCRHVGCGCWLQRKAAWRSERCPLRKWPGDA